MHVSREILLKQLGAPEEVMARLLGPTNAETPPTRTDGGEPSNVTPAPPHGK